MKCPYCCQEHPDNAKFCMETGQKLEPQKRACQNRDCPDFGAAILPLEAKFCPRCGHPVGGASESVSMNPAILEFEVEDVSFNMILVEHGTFTMGANSEQKKSWKNFFHGPWKNEKPAHEVSFTKDYYMGETQVTQALWKAVMGDNPSLFKGGKKPVETVCWDDCQKFIKELNRRLRSQLYGKSFRLPTEAEWEFAARGGNKSCGYQFSGSDDLDEVACYSGNSNDETCDVASFEPNELGFYDMSGNVCEWCLDLYGGYNRSAQTDPQGPSCGSHRVARGGCWYYGVRACRLSCRHDYCPDFRFEILGLRLALSE